MILLIDNFDSFVYNLARYVSELHYPYCVYRNNAITLQDIKNLHPSHIILSPGPATPNEAGICLSLIKSFAGKIPILGVCLGHQAIGQAFGATITRAKEPRHGKSSLITHHRQDIFSNIHNPLTVARYHSLIIQELGLPKSLLITAKSPLGEIMAIRHIAYPVFGVQFHPESILTKHGHCLLENFCTIGHNEQHDQQT